MHNAYIVGPGPLAPGAGLDTVRTEHGVGDTELGAMLRFPKFLTQDSATRHARAQMNKNCMAMSNDLYFATEPLHFFAENTPGRMIVLCGNAAGNVSPCMTPDNEQDFTRLCVEVSVRVVLREMTQHECDNLHPSHKHRLHYNLHLETYFLYLEASKNGIHTVSCYLKNAGISARNLLQLPVEFKPGYVDNKLKSGISPDPPVRNACTVGLNTVAPCANIDTAGEFNLLNCVWGDRWKASRLLSNMSSLLFGEKVEMLIQDAYVDIVVRGTVTGKVSQDDHSDGLYVEVCVDTILVEINKDSDEYESSIGQISVLDDSRVNKRFRRTERPSWIKTMSCYLVHTDIEDKYLLQIPKVLQQDNATLHNCKVFEKRKDIRWNTTPH